MNKGFAFAAAAGASLALASDADAARVYQGAIDQYDALVTYEPSPKFVVPLLDTEANLSAANSGPGTAPDYLIEVVGQLLIELDFDNTVQEFSVGYTLLTPTPSFTPEISYYFETISFLPDVNFPSGGATVFLENVQLESVAGSSTGGCGTPGAPAICGLVNSLSFSNGGIFFNVAGISAADVDANDDILFNFSYEAHAVPLPAALPLLAGGVVALGLMRRRRKAA